MRVLIQSRSRKRERFSTHCLGENGSERSQADTTMSKALTFLCDPVCFPICRHHDICATVRPVDCCSYKRLAVHYFLMPLSVQNAITKLEREVVLARTQARTLAIYPCLKVFPLCFPAFASCLRLTKYHPWHQGHITLFCATVATRLCPKSAEA